VWNHDFFWESLAPNGGGQPPEPVLKRIVASFGSLETFRDKFVDEAVNHFGSGWAWLVAKGGKLEIVTTHDADNPLTSRRHSCGRRSRVSHENGRAGARGEDLYRRVKRSARVGVARHIE
jgi:superoxide dismutase